MRGGREREGGERREREGGERREREGGERREREGGEKRERGGGERRERGGGRIGEGGEGREERKRVQERISTWIHNCIYCIHRHSVFSFHFHSGNCSVRMDGVLELKC